MDWLGREIWTGRTAFVSAVGAGGRATRKSWRRRLNICHNVGVVWLHRELRLQDNVLLEAARKMKQLAIVFVDDPELYGMDSEGREFLNNALSTLREELLQCGSNLVVRQGGAAQELLKISQLIGADTILTSDSADYRWHSCIDKIRSSFGGTVEVVSDPSMSDPKMPNSTGHYSRLTAWTWRNRARTPIPAPDELPSTPQIDNFGQLSLHGDDQAEFTSYYSPYLKERELDDDRNANGLCATAAEELIKRPHAFLQSVVGDGKDLFRSLRYALFLGCVSLTQLSAAGASEKALAKSWHQRVALSDVSQPNIQWKYWLWRGCMIRFRDGGQLSDPEAPAILFIHGFGASCEHYNKNLKGLSDRFKVFAVDLIGFGRSEKPATNYTQHLWEAQIADFVREVVREPVVVVGNSIGGYMSMSFAADHFPTLCKGIVLVNSAGSLSRSTSTEDDQEAPEPPGKARNDFIVFASKGAIFLLQSQIRSILEKLYPERPEEVTDELVRDIYRDSTDPGAAYVLESGVRLPKRRSLVGLLDNYGGPLLVLQGAKDPLNDAVARAKAIDSIYPQGEVILLDGGHCPHDELPEIFNERLREWIIAMEKPLATSPI